MKLILNIKYIVAWVYCIICLHGCMGGMAGWKGHNVRKDNRISIVETAGKTRGVWETGDLSLKYEYLIRGDRIELDGETILTDKLTHFTTLDHLSIMVQFLDTEGMVLGHEILFMSSSRALIPMIRISFNRSFALPSETTSMSFSYSGKVRDGSGDDGIDWDFWSTP